MILQQMMIMERLRKLRDKLIILTQTMMFSLIILYSL